MLIRLTGHFLKNPQHIDKLICVKGLPDDWVFRKRLDGRKELAKPWEPDIDANIPVQVRHLCEPIDIVQYFSPIEKGKDGITDERRILGVRLNFMSEPGRDMWARVERYIDESTPRDAKIPEPVLVAKDQKSPFETYLPRKRVTGGVELVPSEVPVVDLRPPAKPVIVPVTKAEPAPVVITPAEQAIPDMFKCGECSYESEKPQAIRMHRVKRHPKVKVA